MVLPPLRERRRELPVLAREFLRRACERAGRAPMSFSVNAMQVLLAHTWPGNVRELRNAMDYAAAINQGPVLMPWHLPERLGGPPGAGAPQQEAQGEEGAPGSWQGEAPPRFRPLGQEIQELERRRIAEALAATGGGRRRRRS